MGKFSGAFQKSGTTPSRFPRCRWSRSTVRRRSGHIPPPDSAKSSNQSNSAAESLIRLVVRPVPRSSTVKEPRAEPSGSKYAIFKPSDETFGRGSRGHQPRAVVRAQVNLPDSGVGGVIHRPVTYEAVARGGKKSRMRAPVPHPLYRGRSSHRHNENAARVAVHHTRTGIAELRSHPVTRSNPSARQVPAAPAMSPFRTDTGTTPRGFPLGQRGSCPPPEKGTGRDPCGQSCVTVQPADGLVGVVVPLHPAAASATASPSIPRRIRRNSLLRRTLDSSA